MRIAVLVFHFPSLSQTFVLNQIAGLIERGHEVDVYAREPDPGSTVHPDVEKYQLIERTTYIDIPKKRAARWKPALRIIARRLFTHPRMVLGALNSRRFGAAARSLVLLFVADAFMGRDYDVLYCQFGENGNYGAMLKSLGFRFKLVTQFHGYDIRMGLEKGGQIYRDLFRTVDAVLSISDYNRKNLLNFGLESEKIIHHPVGIDLRKFEDRWKGWSGSVPSRVKILTVARLQKEKALHLGIEAIAHVIQANPGLEIEYNIIGGGPLETELRKLVEDLKLDGVVRFLGGKKQTEVIAALQENHIFLLPSVAEALPVVIMEALAAGLPVLATKVGSVHELVIDGRNGFVVPPNDVNALVEKLGLMVSSPGQWREWGRMGREHIRANYDVNLLNDRLVELFERLAGTREQSRSPTL